MLESGAVNLLRERLQLLYTAQHQVRNGEPPECVVNDFLILGVSAPYWGVLLPKALDDLLRTDLIDRSFHIVFVLAECRDVPLFNTRQTHFASLFNCAHKIGEGLRERPP